MAKITIELTLDQLVEAIKRLSLEEQLKLVQSLFKEAPEESIQDRDKGLSQSQVRAEVDRLIQELGERRRRQTRLSLDSWTFDEEDDSELTVFTDLQADEFQA